MTDSAALAGIVKIRKGKKVESYQHNPADGFVRYIQIGDLRNDNGIKYTASRGVEVHPKHVIIAWDGANAGTVGYGLSGVIGSTLARLEIDTHYFDVGFFGRFLQSKSKYLRDRATGATIPHIDKKTLMSLRIPVIPLEDQKRIVSYLNQADALRRKRRESMKLLDGYVQAVFMEMFGDPVTNPKNWPKEKFGKLGTLDRGKSKHRPRNAPELLGGSHPLIQTGDVAQSNILIRNYKSTYSDFGLKQSKKWPTGTLCITIAANIADAGILTFDACFPDSVVGFVPDPEKTNNLFVLYWLSFLKEIIEKNAPQVAQKNINLRILRDLDLIVPPVNLQNEFQKIVLQVEEIKEKMFSQSLEIDNQFNALMQKAFVGAI
ncbi:MAG TPA: restriction endonuclease subunit S [Candidatus Peribacteraceae bacterium]|nr:restriction endonuclease subunit S [Candidatus Peribacteraceae bacterium]